MQYGAGSISSTHVVGLKVFAFYSSKGGTGKTTLAANFAYELNRVGVRTLLMGADEVHPTTRPTTSACSSSSSAPPTR